MVRMPLFPRVASRSGRGWIVAVVLVALAAVVAYFAVRDRDASSAVEPESEVARHEPGPIATSELVASPPAERAVAPLAVQEARADAAPTNPAVKRSANATIRLLSNGEPLRQGRVVLLGSGGTRHACDLDAATGEARFTDLKPFEYRVALEAIPEGWLVTRALANDRDREGGERIRPKFGENRFDFDLEPGAVVHGIVYDENGWPEQDATVQINSLEPRERHVQTRYATVTDGAFQVNVHDGASLIEVVNGSAQKRRVPPNAQAVVLAAGARADLEFRFEKGAETFAGRIVDETGAPFAGLKVRISRDQPMPEVAGARSSTGPLRQALAGAKTDSDGRFAFEGLPRGTCSVYIEEKGVSPFDRPGDATVARIQLPRTVEVPLAEPWVVTIERAHPVLVRGRVLVKRKGEVVLIEAVLAAGERRAQERRQNFSVQYDGTFEFYVDGTESNAAVELKRDGRVRRVPIPLSAGATEVSVEVALP